MDVKTLCLGALKLGDATGYELKKQFEEGPFAYFHQAGYGSIYPALSALLREGKVTCREEIQQGRPNKKVYSLTAAGKADLQTALHQRPALDKVRSDVVFMLFFAEMVDEAHLRGVYDDYLTYFRQRLEHLHSLDNTDIPAGRRFVRGMGAAFYESMEAYLSEHRQAFLATANTQNANTQDKIENLAKTGTDQ